MKQFHKYDSTLTSLQYLCNYFEKFDAPNLTLFLLKIFECHKSSIAENFIFHFVIVKFPIKMNLKLHSTFNHLFYAMLFVFVFAFFMQLLTVAISNGAEIP